MDSEPSKLTIHGRIFYWFGAFYSLSLLTQAVLMILVQSMLLKVALDNRPPSGIRNGLEHAPFSAYSHEGVIQQFLSGKRPYQFWQWPTPRPYVLHCLSYPPDSNVMVAYMYGQVLLFPALPDPLPFPRSRFPPSHLRFDSIHILPRLRRSRHRSHPPSPSDFEKPTGTVV